MTDIREPGVLERLADNLALLTGAVATLTAAIGSAPKTEITDVPKATRQRRTTAAGATEKETAPSTIATSATDQAASTAKSEAATDKETDDLFGDDPAPAKEEKVKEVTIDDVRAKLVEVQTKFKHKDHALACLKKITGGLVLSGLKKEDHGKLVDLCTEVLKKDTPPKF